MEKIIKDFCSTEKRVFKWSLGRILASSLSGFLAGIIVAVIIIFAFCDVALKN